MVALVCFVLHYQIVAYNCLGIFPLQFTSLQAEEINFSHFFVDYLESIIHLIENNIFSVVLNLHDFVQKIKKAYDAIQ
jgi:hypothetical protein